MACSIAAFRVDFTVLTLSQVLGLCQVLGLSVLERNWGEAESGVCCAQGHQTTAWVFDTIHNGSATSEELLKAAVRGQDIRIDSHARRGSKRCGNPKP